MKEPNRKLRRDEAFMNGQIIRITPEKLALAKEIDHIHRTSIIRPFSETVKKLGLDCNI